MGLIGAGGLCFFLSAYWSFSLAPEERYERRPQGSAKPSRPILDTVPRRSAQPHSETTPNTQVIDQRPGTTISRDPMVWNPFGTLGSGAESEAQKKSTSDLSAIARTPSAAATTSAPKGNPVITPFVVPTAPLVPFEIVGGISGKNLGDGRPFAFLRMGNDVIVAKSGDEVDGYRVEEITNDHVKMVRVTDGRHLMLSRRHP